MIELVAWDDSVVKALSDAYGSAIFLVTRGLEANAASTLHVTAQGDDRRAIQTAERFGAARVKLQRHAPDLLASPTSLESLVSRLTHGQQIIADPTGAVTKAVQLAEAARRARMILPKRVRGLYFNPSRGLVFVWVKEPPAAEQSRAAMEAILAEAGAAWACAILTPVLPARGLVAVDEASVRAAKTQTHRARLGRALTTAAAAVGLSGAMVGVAAAQTGSELPVQAVVQGGGGELDGTGYGVVNGSIGVYDKFYGQIDAQGAFTTDIDSGGGALQAGIRDPEHYRAGVFIAYGSSDANFTMGGVYGDFFVNNLNLRIEALDLSVTKGPDRIFGSFGADYYFDDNTKIFADVTTDGDDSFGSAGVEHAFQSLSGLSLGAAGTYGPGDDGFKVYAKYWFGAPGESLKHNDRYGPAKSVLDPLLFAEAQRLANQHAATYGGGGSTPT